jgi:hypothetical protein
MRFGITLLPEVKALPDHLTDDTRPFFNQLVGEPFRSRLGKRGKRSGNGRSWTHDQFVGPFCDEYYPQLSMEAREQYELVLGQVSTFIFIFYFCSYMSLLMI